jgi:diguanylate cyclase (GGDEF)-like protein
MQRRLISPKEVTDQEARRLAEPAALASVILCCLLIISGLDNFLFSGKDFSIPIIMGSSGILYAVILFYGIMPSPSRLEKYKWFITVSNAISISVGLIFLPENLDVIPQIILIMIAAIMIILWDRPATYIFIILSGGSHLLMTFSGARLVEVVIHSSFFLVAAITVETIKRLADANMKRVNRLQAINRFLRRISSSLDADEVLELISDAINDALDADSFFFGIVDGNQLQIRLIYDDGEVYPPTSVPLEGSLSGWVIRNQQSLFIADLRIDLDLDGVQQILIGKDKTSLCWMGVPLHANNINGVFAVASYDPNDFDRADLELLENLAQQAALVLDNAYQHAEVQAQSRLDSLTGVYNHGYIVNILNNEAENCVKNKAPLCLIMLDIDFFKQYNDNYGHMVGDQVLVALTHAIRQHIKAGDSIGRWGGEEFTIVLPGTSGLQTQLVAERIQETVSSLSIRDRDGNELPFPTVSQGVAIFPDEASDVHKLIDLADQRLYVAKVRGRNQIEPKGEHWTRIK